MNADIFIDKFLKKILSLPENPCAKRTLVGNLHDEGPDSNFEGETDITGFVIDAELTISVRHECPNTLAEKLMKFFGKTILTVEDF